MAARGARVSMVDPRERRPCLKELEVIYAEQVRTRKEGRNIASIAVTIKFASSVGSSVQMHTEPRKSLGTWF